MESPENEEAGLLPLERAVLELMLDKEGEPYETIRKQLGLATVERREYSGVGFFTHFRYPPSIQRTLPNMHVNDVGMDLPGVEHGAGFLLFVRNGVAEMLEGYTYGEYWPERTDDFRVFRVNVFRSQCDVQPDE